LVAHGLDYMDGSYDGRIKYRIKIGRWFCGIYLFVLSNYVYFVLHNFGFLDQINYKEYFSSLYFLVNSIHSLWDFVQCQ
jgi:hypothetical protein